MKAVQPRPLPWRVQLEPVGSQRDLCERYQRIIIEYSRDKHAIEVQKVMNDLLALNDKLNDEEKRCLRKGLENDAQLAVIDLLQ